MHELRKAATTLLLNCQTSSCYNRFTVYIVDISRSGCWLHIQGGVIFIQSYCWLEYLCILVLNALLSVITECWVDLEGVSHCTRVKEKTPSSSNRLSSTGLPQPTYSSALSDFKSHQQPLTFLAEIPFSTAAYNIAWLIFKWETEVRVFGNQI